MGRPKKKPEYDSEKIMEQFTNCIVEAYMSGVGGESANSLRQISEQFSITLMKTRKILITAGVYHTELSEQVISLRENGKNISEIMQETGLSRSSVHSYLPYTKMIYNADEYSRAFTVSAISSVILYVALGRTWGIFGIAFSTFAAELILTILLIFNVRKLR